MGGPRRRAAASYDCEHRVLKSGTDEVILEDSFVYERVAQPIWYTEGTKMGLGDIVPKPWTPVQCGDDAVGVLGRTYTLGGEAVLEQVSAAGEDLLAGPVRLEATVGGQNVAVTGMRRRSLAQSDAKGSYETTGTLGLRFDLELKSEAETIVDGLRLVVPLRPERAIYYHHCSSYYARGYAGLLPEEGLSLGFRPFVWLGDDERGLMWFAESTRGWAEGEEPIQVRRTPEATELVIDFVGGKTLMQGTSLTFGLQATPAKPAPDDWRSWRVDRVWVKRQLAKMELSLEDRDVPLAWRLLWFCDGRVPLYCNLHTAPLDVMDEFTDWVDGVHERGTRVVPYLYLHGVSAGATGYERYYPIWQITSPRQIGGGERVIMGACPSSSFGDYLLYGIAQWAEKYGADGVYFDGAGPPVECGNTLHHHGWSTTDGARHIEFPIFGLREFYKRLWIILSERVDDPIVWTHADGKMPIPCFSFTTANWIGEMVQGPLRTGDAFLSDMQPLDWWRAYMQATQWGPVPMWLVTTARADEEMRLRQQMDTWALLLVHGTPFARRGHLSNEQIDTIWSAQSDFGIGDANFHGYWANGSLVGLSPEDPGIVASFYERDGKVMLVIANFTDEDQQVSATLSGVAQSASGGFADVMTGETVAAPGGVVSVTVGAKSFRLLRG